LLDGAIRFEELLARCKQLGMEAVAVTDHGSLFGVVEFYIKALDASIRPIIGMEAYVAPGSRFDKSKAGIGEAADHLLLLAKDNRGYKNLMRLSSIGYIEGFYYRPRIDKEVLAEFHEGLIGCSACLKGEITAAIARGDMEQARTAAEQYAKIFGQDNFYLEIQRHDGQHVDIVGPTLDLANRIGLPVVATNDVHFLDAEDYEAHNCLCAIGTGKLATDPDRLIYPPSVYLKGPDQMRQLFADVPQACDATLEIANRCHVELDPKTRHAPRFHCPDGSSPEQFLTALVYQGAKQRYGQITSQLEERIQRELQVINSKGLASYFLIVWDFCQYARSQQIRLGARGSGVGTVVGYCLGLSDVDPLKYDLLFERFIDPQRAEMPDIDIDICQVHRQQVIDYVRQKYGHVAQIITFGTMKARAVIRDICRVLGVPLAEADRLAKLVPATLDMTLDRALQTEPELAEAYQNKPLIRKVLDIGRKLEGLARHASVHAAGVVVSDEPLIDLIPLYKQPGSDDLITQFEGPMVEKVGLLKMDFLGLKTLSVLELARQLVRQNHQIDVDIDNLDLHDAKTFDLFASGKTKGVFQFESAGMQSMLVKMRPDRIEDLIAANALYRPGPMVLIEDYIARKHGAPWTCPHPIISQVLDETYGIMVYQEQVMRICNLLGDIPLRDAYKLIKAISKKQADVISQYRQQFISGAIKKDLKPEHAEQIWEIIERFAGYGFNKSHSTRYAFVAYQTAYMKAHWPVEFMAALLTYETGDTDKVVEYIDECRNMGIEVLPPDINESGVWFTPLHQGTQRKGVIRFGLAAVKGVGQRAVEQIIEAR
jgi:DNA polymerase-3 subunit alpha